MSSIKSSFEQIFQTHLKEGFILFCGAGLSIPPPSCSPSWWQLTEEILKAFFEHVPDEYNIPKDLILEACETIKRSTGRKSKKDKICKRRKECWQ